MTQTIPLGVRVLVVDDDHVFLKLMAGILDACGCLTVYCENGRQAVEALRKEPFDLCFMDIMMPVMNGIEAAQIIRDEITKTMPIIAITASGMSATRDKCQDVGMDDFIVKPIGPDAIRNALALYAQRKP